MNAFFIMRFHCSGSLVTMESMAMVAVLNLTIGAFDLIQLFNFSFSLKSQINYSYACHRAIDLT